MNDQRGRDALIYCCWFMLEYWTSLKFALWLNKLATPTQYNFIFIIINLNKNKQYFNLEIYRDTNFQQVRGLLCYLVGGGLSSSVNPWVLVALIWNHSHSDFSHFLFSEAQTIFVKTFYSQIMLLTLSDVDVVLCVLSWQKQTHESYQIFTELL